MATLTLPILQLNSRLVFMPGVIYKTSYSYDQAKLILNRFSNFSSDKNLLKFLDSKSSKSNDDDVIDVELSKDAVKGIIQFNKFFATADSDSTEGQDWLIIGCLPTYDNKDYNDKVATICRISKVYDNDSEVMIYFQAMTRGKLVDTNSINESLMEIEIDLQIDNSFLKQFQKNGGDYFLKVLNFLQDINRFMDEFTFALKIQTNKKLSNSLDHNEKLKYAFLTLSPLANVLHSQLSKNEMLNGFQKLEKLFKNLNQQYTNGTMDSQATSKNLLKLADLLFALFPFTLYQKTGFLFAFNNLEKRLKIFIYSIEFGIRLFEECLNVEFILENWDILKAENVPSSLYDKSTSSSFRSKLISNHLKSLKILVDDIGSKSSQVSNGQKINTSNSVPARGLPLTRNNNNTDDNEDTDNDFAGLTKFIQEIGDYKIPEDAVKLIRKDFNRLKRMSPNHSEYHLLHSYLEIVQDIPWELKVANRENSNFIDLRIAKEQLDKDHYGLQNAKDRILQYLAVLNLHEMINKRNVKNNEGLPRENDKIEPIVIENFKRTSFGKAQPHRQREEKPKQKLQHQTKAPILLLTGPPGVGKTSLAKSIATALNRNFQRISLGGLKDESEIKGHRRTYVGAMPGLIVQALRKAQVMNPIILLDEIDKVVSGARGGMNRVNGDPAAALLEVLDPEQNVNFQDHYIGFPIDLSQVLFICTSNDHHLLSGPLRDRMEVLELNGYNYFEKMEIARKYLLTRQIKRNGLPLGYSPIQLSDEVLLKIATSYTREPGVRNLERLLGSICRKKAIEYSKLLKGSQDLNSIPQGYKCVIKIDDLPRYIGIPPHLTSSQEQGIANSLTSIKFGIVNGLSYNSDGSGGTLIFEMTGLPSSSYSLQMTGRLGNVLTESAKIGSSLIRSILNKNLLQFKNGKYDCLKLLEKLNKMEIHLHVPAGSISKDGPSAGITITLCLLSLLLEKPVPSNIAMTGEITLRGLVLPIGGVREKILGAHLAGNISKVLLPRLNRRDIIEEFITNNNSITKSEEKDHLLTLLIKNEEKLLSSSSSASSQHKNQIFEEPEQWVKEKLGIEIMYVEEFADVIQAVWGHNTEASDDSNDANNSDDDIKIVGIEQKNKFATPLSRL
ncbi:hypothetical protein PACTADRAFT_48278 [Pachysolen tannophilus NRRL Y-2460]|uniref:Lon protease homolog 2, peroxisomal n=1 Tax=Pachysolen tannophilus NRRL Y-2460 TaxID=669874 RepID=A0A1E4U3H2_PACTA|nr:hypothetical protein PACTADRAFT_48278 [Pachysolen tannophilus NRRL Y-2460]